VKHDGAHLALLAVCLAASLALFATLAIVRGSVPAAGGFPDRGDRLMAARHLSIGASVDVAWRF
jgi:hypothetical protein